MTITSTLPDLMPNRQQEPEVFVPAMDAFIACLPDLAEQIDIAIAAFNFNSVTDSSSTSNWLETGAGNKTFTVSLGKSFSPGMYLVMADAAAPSTNSMIVQVYSYTGTTLVVTPLYLRGTSAIYSSWLITQGSVPPSLVAGASILSLTTGNGNGSSSTKIRRFTTTVTNTAVNDITYADSSTLGGVFTIVTSGVYCVTYSDIDPSDPRMGISKNSNQLTTNFASITEAHKWLFISTSQETASRTGYLAAGDVLRCHNGGGLEDANTETKLIIERLL